MDEKTKKGELGEEFVNNLSYNSFLKFWCYPNPKDEERDKKEICDLLILFRDICIIISVKNYEFKGDYSRYDKKTVGKAIKPGIRVIEPTTEANKKPITPDSFPIILIIRFVSIIESMSPTRRIIPKRRGNIFLNKFHDFVKAFFVFCLLFIKEIIKKTIAIKYIAPLKIMFLIV